MEVHVPAEVIKKLHSHIERHPEYAEKMRGKDVEISEGEIDATLDEEGREQLDRLTKDISDDELRAALDKLLGL